MVPEGQEVEEDHGQLRWLCWAENITTVGWLKKENSDFYDFRCMPRDRSSIARCTLLAVLSSFARGFVRLAGHLDQLKKFE